MKVSTEEVLHEAVRERHGNESFEKALGRVLRNHHGTYADYIDLISRVRDRASRDGSSLREAAQAMAAER